jgi:hypothetical protein
VPVHPKRNIESIFASSTPAFPHQIHLQHSHDDHLLRLVSFSSDISDSDISLPHVAACKSSNLVLKFGSAELQGLFRRCMRRQAIVALVRPMLLDAGLLGEDGGSEGQNGDGEEELHCDGEVGRWSGCLK